MPLEQCACASLLVYLGGSPKCTAPRPCMTAQYRTQDILTVKRTCIFEVIWVGGLEEYLDSVQRCDDGLCLYVSVSKGAFGDAEGYVRRNRRCLLRDPSGR